MNEDSKLTQRYRELPREEPPRPLDDAILAASRRAVDARPAPLVAPSGRKRWYFPLAAAAVIVLAVAVTVHVERERPDAEAVSGPVATQGAKLGAPRGDEAAAAPAPAPKPIAKKPPTPAPAQPTFTPEPKPEAKAEAVPERRNEMQERPAERDLASAPAAPPAPAAEPPVAAARSAPAPEVLAQASRQRAIVTQAPSAVDERRPVGALAKLGARSPEQWLQGIDDLKRQGRHEEAGKELAEFRKRYPDYKIPEAILLKFEK